MNSSEHPQSEPTAPEAQPVGTKVVVVPHVAGPLLTLDRAQHRRSPDDLDQLVDDLFGPSDDETAGWFDLGLLGLGAALLAWATLGHGPGLALAGGIVAGGLGVVLPIRTVWRALGRKRARRRTAAILGEGIPLVLNDPPVVRVAAAYDGLLAALPSTSPAQPGSLHLEALRAAHAAVVECASLLQGRPTSSEAEHRYLAERSAAIEALTSVVQDANVNAANSIAEGGPLPAAQVVKARDELDALSGTSSLKQLDQLIAEFRDGR